MRSNLLLEFFFPSFSVYLLFYLNSYTQVSHDKFPVVIILFCNFICAVIIIFVSDILSLSISSHFVCYLHEPILIPFLSNYFEFLLFVAIICAVYILCMLATTFLHNTFQNSIFLLCFLMKINSLCTKRETKTFTHPVPLFVVNKTTTTTATSIIITATTEYFAGDQRGEKHFHTERMILSEKAEQFFCYVEKNKYFSHLHYNFFPLFPLTICCYSWSLN